MSRIGRIPIPVPAGVEVKIAEGNAVTVKGPKGQLSRQLHPDMVLSIEDGTLTVARPSESNLHRSLHGLSRTLLANMVEGVTKGFQKNLEISGVGYRALKLGDRLMLQVGYSHPVELEAPENISFVVEGTNKVGVVGIDKEVVGQVAASIRAIRKPEPYKGKGIRYAGEYIRRKAGKAGRAGGKKK